MPSAKFRPSCLSVLISPHSAVFTYRFHEFWIGQNKMNLTATAPSRDPPYEAEVRKTSLTLKELGIFFSKCVFIF